MKVVPLEPARAELAVSNSRFIALLGRASSLEEARAFLARARAEFPDASHHVPAFLIGSGRSTTEFCSDDGEPSGTSGRPLLAVLRGSGLGDAALVVVRYFGGTLLGTGGLVKAYAEAGRLVLERARRAELVELERVELDLGYALYERLKASALELGAAVVEEAFAERVRLVLDLPAEALERFASLAAEASGGSASPRRLGSRPGLRPLGR
ncbi:MAG TPA: YigZ family protein [Spirochaetales bacterium]|nr:YigZ family protein [Spirochaetales bacterium]HRY55302.1 YigZ family protein [Spirochaetia bacterium]HRZ64342.1 YigZ family protein [Spirochaetia bacterium]